jgi:hypothetical protein
MNASERALRLDECGAWQVTGKHGHIYSWGDGRSFVLVTGGESIRHWSAIKRRLSFCKVTQDGDCEGCLRLFELPTRKQAAEILSVLGIRKRRDVTLSTRRLGNRAIKGVSCARTVETALSATSLPHLPIAAIRGAERGDL